MSGMWAGEVFAPIRCCRCQAELPREAIETRQGAICPGCNSEVIVRAFPAILNKPERISPDAIQAGEGEATCFFHPGKTAAASCSRCGRFLCQLCRVEFRGDDWCPDCLSSGIKKKKIATLENHRNLYDTIALGIALLPLPFFWPLTIIGAPAAIYVAIRYWKAPLSIVRRTRIRFVAAILIAVTQLAAWTWLVVYLVAMAVRRT
jgi:DNA-directed RNA polymerase subunit RPC12/RpoP